MVNNIRNNAISEIPAKEGLNVLNKIKNAEITKKRSYTPKQKELSNLFNDLLLDAVLINKTLKSKIQEDNTLISSKDEKDNENENENDKNENDKSLISSKDDDETMNQKNKDVIKQLNDILDEIKII